MKDINKFINESVNQKELHDAGSWANKVDITTKTSKGEIETLPKDVTKTIINLITTIRDHSLDLKGYADDYLNKKEILDDIDTLCTVSQTLYDSVGEEW